MNIERLAAILRQAAQAEILPRFRKLDPGAIETKSSAFDLVTEADRKAEVFITRAITEATPGTMVVGEEAVAADPELLDRHIDAETVIYVDPVDGTGNFAAGLPLFAVMAAVVHKGETVAGVIYDPMGDDWVMAERGCGAWLKTPDGAMTRQSFAAPAALEDMGGSASTSYGEPVARAAYMANLAKVRVMTSYRCAGHEYRAAAGGHSHFLMYSKLMPWDHLAGALIVTEAGGYVARLDGSAYRPEHRDGGILVAPDAASWETLRREVFTV
ncbi:inositol monophosphatase family protein [Pelagibacterium montanilacus]|uniref:inositol monophosphatase family protein n=1 Tax=Pelagibacterium montanilacus TaxID=2185280 RepID=UPI000F8F5906|nr:inositol monophosphatase family protein [Pelagibacterium montanilacus]